MFKVTQKATASYFACDDEGTISAEARIVSPSSGFGLPVVTFEFFAGFLSDDPKNPWHGEFVCEQFNTRSRDLDDRFTQGPQDQLEGAQNYTVRAAVAKVETALNETIKTKAPFYRARTFYLSAQPLGSLSLESNGLGPPLSGPPAKK